MAITANRKFWTEFIDIYRNLPCLWNTKDEKYNDRESRSLAWDKLVIKLKEVEPDAKQDSVKRKINTFRSNFNREVRKLRHTQKEQPTEAYNPTLWYFDLLSFLLNQEKHNTGDYHCDDEMTLMGLTSAKNEVMLENETKHPESINQEYVTDDQNSHEKSIRSKVTSRLGNKNNNRDSLTGLDEKPMLEYISPVAEMESPPIQETARTNYLERVDKLRTLKRPVRILRTNIKNSKIRFKSRNPIIRSQYKSHFLSPIETDEAVIYGQAWACGFRKLSSQQKVFAKKAIDEILILGHLKALKLNMVNMNANFADETSD